MECFGRHSHDRLPLSRVECACLLLSQEQVYLRWAGNATFFRHFLAHFPSILANELRDLTEEGDRKWKKESFRCHARLWFFRRLADATCGILKNQTNPPTRRFPDPM